MKIQNCTSIHNALAGLAGYLSALGFGLSATLSNACAQKLNGLVPAFQLNAWRYAGEAFLSACLVLFTQTEVRVSYIKVPWMILLTFLSLIFSTTYYTAAIYLPIGILELFTTSITYIGTLLLSKRFLYKQTVCFQYVAFIVILLGQLLLWQPCFLFPAAICQNNSSILHNATNNNITPELEYNTPPFWIGYVLVVAASLALSLRTVVYYCQVQDISTSVVSLCTSTLGLLLSLMIMIYMENPTIPLENIELALLLGHAGFAGCASILLIHSQQKLHPMISTIVLNIAVVFGFVLQLSFPQIFIQSVHNSWEFVGIALCVLGVISYVVIDIKIQQVSSK